MWHVDTSARSAEALCCLSAHRDQVRALALVGGGGGGHDGSCALYSSGRDKMLRLWEPTPTAASEADGGNGGNGGDGGGGGNGGGSHSSLASSSGWHCTRGLAAHTDEVLTLTAKTGGAWPRHGALQLGGSVGLLFSASRGGEVRIWDRESLVCLDAWVVSSSAVHALVVRDDCMITASGDGTIKVARAAPARERGGARAPPQTA